MACKYVKFGAWPSLEYPGVYYCTSPDNHIHQYLSIASTYSFSRILLGMFLPLLPPILLWSLYSISGKSMWGAYPSTTPPLQQPHNTCLGRCIISNADRSTDDTTAIHLYDKSLTGQIFLTSSKSILLSRWTRSNEIRSWAFTFCPEMKSCELSIRSSVLQRLKGPCVNVAHPDVKSRSLQGFQSDVYHDLSVVMSAGCISGDFILAAGATHRNDRPAVQWLSGCNIYGMAKSLTRRCNQCHILWNASKCRHNCKHACVDWIVCFGLVLGPQNDDKIQIHIFNYYHYRAATFGGVKGSWLDQQLLAADERECAPTERKSN